MNNLEILIQGVEHPDRVAWYLSVIGELTYQIPGVVRVDTQVAAWVGPYYSQAGLLHSVTTQVWAADVEQVLEALANRLYADLQADSAALGSSYVEVAVAAVG